SGLAATVSSSIAFPVDRLYDLPCSTDFSLGRGRFHQLLSMPLPSCRPYHPAGVTCRVSQSATCHTAFIPDQGIRPSETFFIEATSGFTPFRPDDSLTIPKMASSVGFIRFVSSTNCNAPRYSPPSRQIILRLVSQLHSRLLSWDRIAACIGASEYPTGRLE